jgi:hypothetical protein
MQLYTKYASSRKGVVTRVAYIHVCGISLYILRSDLLKQLYPKQKLCRGCRDVRLRTSSAKLRTVPAAAHVSRRSRARR